MIKANELRIGNLVTTVEGNTAKINLVSNTDVQTDWGSFGINYIEPIPLTEEWLFKFGFGINLPRTAYWNKDEFLIGIIDEKLYFGYWEHDENNDPYVYPISDAPLTYAHQLQNLYFALTGSELVLSNVPCAIVSEQ